MLFLPDTNINKINRLIFLWNGEYCDTEAVANDFAILNCDDKKLTPPEDMTVISCGMSGKATVTASSVKPEGIVCCVQREFQSLDGRLIEPSEFYLPTYDCDISTALSAATANLIINGIFFHKAAYDV